MANPISDAALKQVANAFNSAQGNSTIAARSLGLRRTTFTSRLDIVRVRFPDEVQQFENVKAEIGPKMTPSELAAKLRERETEKSAAASLKDALRHIGELNDKIKDLEWSNKLELKPAEWTLAPHPRKKREHLPSLLTSDAQIGEVSKAEETDAGYSYDVETYRQYHRHLIDTTIYLCDQHGGRDWSFPGIIYERGGDTINGHLRDESRENDEITPIEAVEVAFEEESAGIGKLADFFGRVEVKSPGAGGNHDRDTFKPYASNAAAHSYDRLIAGMLARHFARDKRVTFQTSRSFDVLFPIYGLNVLLTHGDRTGSRGGQGFIGPGATILRGAQKVLMEQAALGRTVHRVDHGHLHYPLLMDWVVSNGSYPGYNAYAKSVRMRPIPPQQILIFHHPAHGAVDYKPIKLIRAS